MGAGRASGRRPASAVLRAIRSRAYPAAHQRVDPSAEVRRRRRTRRPLTALVVTLGLGAGFAFVASELPAGASAPVASASAQFLAGSAGGTDLSTIVGPAHASNSGGAPSVDNEGVDPAVVEGTTVAVGPANLLGPNAMLTVSAGSEYAAANPDGSSRAASGAVNSSGAIAVGGSGPQATATLDLSPLLDSLNLTGTLTHAEVDTGALAATAKAAPSGTTSGTYAINGLTVKLTSPVLAQLATALQGQLGSSYDSLVDGVGPVTSGGVTINLADGTITVDLGALLSASGADLSSFTSPTELLPYITQGLNTSLAAAVNSAAGQLEAAIASALGADAGTQATNTLASPLANLPGSLVTPVTAGLPQLVDLEAGLSGTNANGAFTETALQIVIEPGSGSLGTVELATATVGPNAGPVVASIGAISPGQGPTAGGTAVTLTGSSFLAGSTVEVDGGAPITPSAISADGTSLTFTTPPHLGGTVNVVVTNAAGNSAPVSFTYAPPPAPAITAPSGTVVTATPTISGTGITGDTITVTDGSGAVCTATVGADGTWSCSPGSALANGSHTLSATQSDGVDTSGASAADTFTVDLRPTITGTNPVSGPTAGGTQITLNGTYFTSGVTVTIDGVGVTPDAIAVDGSTLTVTTPAHAAGAVAIVVTNAAGSSAPTSFVFQAPGAPVITTPANGATVVGASPTIAGTGVAGDLVTVKDGTTVVCTATVAADGSWQCTPSTPLSFAQHALLATQSDGPGTSPPSLVGFTVVKPKPGSPVVTSLSPAQGPTAGGTQVTVAGSQFTAASTVSIDGGAPITPTSTATDGSSLTFVTPPHTAGPASLVITNETGPSTAQVFLYVAPDAPVITAPTANSKVVGPRLPIGGTGAAGDKVVVTEAGLSLCAVTVDADGDWTCPSVALGTGPHTIVATQSDVESASQQSAPDSFTVIVPAPGAPRITKIAPASGPTTGGTTVVVTGTGFRAGTVAIVDGTHIATTITSTTTLSLRTPSHAAGPVDLVVVNTIGSSNSVLFAFVPPAAPVIISPTAGSSVVTRQPLISGSGAPGYTVTVSSGASALCSGTVAATGMWTCTPGTPLAVGPQTISAVQSWGAVTSSASIPVTFTVATAPPPPTIAPPAGGSLLTDSQPSISGTGVAGDSVTVREGSDTVCATIVGADARWSCKPAHPFGDGRHTLVATQVNASGRSSSDSEAITFTIITPLQSGLPISGTRALQLIELGLIVLVGGLVVLAGWRRRSLLLAKARTPRT